MVDQHPNPGAQQADPTLMTFWEPPRLKGKTLRFCYDDNAGSFGVVNVDLETLAVSSERLCDASYWVGCGRGYSDGAGQRMASVVFVDDGDYGAEGSP